jgi:uncharacterized protein
MARWARAAVALVLVVLSAFVLARHAKPSTPELADLLPADLSPWSPAAAQAGDLLLVAVVGDGEAPSDDRIARVERALAKVPGVSTTTSRLTRPRLSLDEPVGVSRGRAGSTSRLDSFLARGHAHPILALLDPSLRSEEGAEAFGARIDALLAELAEPGSELLAFADPLMRAAYRRQSLADFGWGLAIIFLPIVLLAMVLLGSPHGAAMALVLGLTTAAATTLSQQLVDGRASPVAAFLLPFAFSVATLDAFHLSRRHQVLFERGDPTPARTAATELWRPCLLTTATTAVGLAVLSWTSTVPLLRDIGTWAAFATTFAYVATFTVGTGLLPLEPAPPRGLGRSAERCMRRLVCASLRHPERVKAIWGALVLLSVPLVAQLEGRPTYPDPFVEGHPWSAKLERLERSLDVSADVIQINVSSDLEAQAGRIRAFNGTLALQTALERDPAVALALGAGTLLVEIPHTPAALARLEALRHDERATDAVITRALAEPIAVNGRIQMTTLVVLAREADPDAFAARLMHFAEARAHKIAVELRGPRHTRSAIQAISLSHVRSSLPASFLAIALVLLLLRGVRRAWVALVSSSVPVLIAASLLSLIGSGWNLAMLAGVTVLLAVAVDDSIHLLWPLRSGADETNLPRASDLTRLVPVVGPALVATSLVLVGSFLALASSSIQFNRDQGLIAAIGLVVALIADLTLLPAMLRPARRNTR